jgi:hypothetical protein
MMSNGNTRDFHTIDSSNRYSNTNSLNCTTKIITAITLTSRITLMNLITRITESRNNQPGITNGNINLMRAQTQNERTIIQIQATVTKLLLVHTHAHTQTHTYTQQRTKQVNASACAIGRAGQFKAHTRASLTALLLRAALAATSAWTQAM